MEVLVIKKRNVLITLMLVVAVVVVVVFVKKSMDDKVEQTGEAGTVESPVIGEVPGDDELGEAVEQPKIDPYVEQLNKMTLDEKIGQLILAGFQGTYLTDEAKELIHRYKVGGFILFAHNLEHPAYSVELLNDIKRENQKNDIPVLLGIDQEGGRVTRLPGLKKLPTNAFIGSKDDGDFAFEYGQLIGDQVKAFGFQFNFAPVMDVNSNPNNPVIGDRSFGSDPVLVSKMGVGMIKGMQSKNVIPVIKHFPGHGDTSVDSHETMPTVHKTLSELEALELIPFRVAIEEGVDVVMTSHIALPEIGGNIPATMSKEVITDLLREEIGFDGVVITDDLTMGAIADYGVAEAANEAIKAGVDIVLVAFGHDQMIATINRIKESVETGEISEERIDESVLRILRLKDKYHVVDELNDMVDMDELQEEINDLVK